jgi:hypothetical protein
VAAINGTDGINTPHPSVDAGNFAANACLLTALVGGVAGNATATTETFTAGTNVFDAATLGTTTAGVDCTKGDARTALVAAITASDTQGVGAAAGAGDTMTLTADVAGDVGNDIATIETMANGAFGAATLAGGVDGTPGYGGAVCVDAGFIYVCTATDLTVQNDNWERAAIAAF